MQSRHFAAYFNFNWRRVKQIKHLKDGHITVRGLWIAWAKNITNAVSHDFKNFDFALCTERFLLNNPGFIASELPKRRIKIEF